MTESNWTTWSTYSTDNVTATDGGSGVDDLAALRQQLETTRFVVQRLLAPMIICVGIMGNIVTVIVLAHRSMIRSSTNTYLSALAVYDAVYLALAFSMTWKHYESVSSEPWYVRYRLPVGRPLIDTASNTAVWLTVTFTIERFIAVRFPMKGKIWCTRRRAIYVVLIVCITACLVTLPEFFEFVVVEQPSPVTLGNDSTSSNPTQPVVRPALSEFGASPRYQFGYNYVNQSLFTFLPLILLFIFNSLLVNAVLSAARVRQSMTGSTASDCRSGDRDTTEQRITVMLISVVVVFLICQLPQAIQKLYTVYLMSTPSALTAARRLQLAIGGNLCNLLVVVNSAVNFLLYSALSVKFRRTFEKRFLCRGDVRRSSRADSVYTGASYTASTAVPLTSVTPTARADLPQRSHHPRTASTNFSVNCVVADSSTLLDGSVNS